MNHLYFEAFLSYLEKEDKDQAVRYAISLLNEKKIDIETLYLELLTPSLTHFSCKEEDADICIWKEHLRTSIIRTILEICYLHILTVIKPVKVYKPKIVVLTPAFELHEIGAIMSTHFMMLEGLNASYIGSNTPKNEILNAIRAYQPDMIALSVTNPYNLIVTKQTTDDIRRFFPEVKIILGGQAFTDLNHLGSIQFDYNIQSFAELKAFAKAVKQ
jgi:MerR family transcriptional regulator, light-induced transcriptional regulator